MAKSADPINDRLKNLLTPRQQEQLRQLPFAIQLPPEPMPPYVVPPPGVPPPGLLAPGAKKP